MVSTIERLRVLLSKYTRVPSRISRIYDTRVYIVNCCVHGRVQPVRMTMLARLGVRTNRDPQPPSLMRWWACGHSRQDLIIASVGKLLPRVSIKYNISEMPLPLWINHYQQLHLMRLEDRGNGRTPYTSPSMDFWSQMIFAFKSCIDYSDQGRIPFTANKRASNAVVWYSSFGFPFCTRTVDEPFDLMRCGVGSSEATTYYQANRRCGKKIELSPHFMCDVFSCILYISQPSGYGNVSNNLTEMRLFISSKVHGRN